MKVAACQLPHIHKDVPRALSLIESYAADAEQAGVQLICFPECFLQGYDVSAEHVFESALDLKSSEFTAILRRFEDREPVVVLGLIERDRERFYNSAVAIHHGEVIARYRKNYLLQGEQSVFNVGTGCAVFDVSGVRVAINICFDLNFSESVRRVALAGATLVICPCNNMMCGSSAEQWKPRHIAIRANRAQKHGVWLLSSDVTGTFEDRVSYGPTAVIDPQGSIVDQVPLMTTGMVIATIGITSGHV